MSAVAAPAMVTARQGSGRRQASVQALLVPAILVAVVTGVVVRDPTTPAASWWLGAVLGAFVLMLNSPSWVAAPLLLVEFTLPDYMVPGLGMSLRLTVATLSLILLAPFVLRDLQAWPKAFRQVILPAMALVVLSTVVNLMFSDFNYAFKYLRYVMSAFVIMIVFVAAIRSRQDLRRVALVALLIALASAGAAIQQHYMPGSPVHSGSVTPATISYWGSRALGLTENPVLLAGDLAPVLVPLLVVLVSVYWKGGRARTVLFLAAVVLLLGLYFTTTRSGLLAAGVGLAFSGLMLHGQPRKITLSAVIGAVILFELLQGTGLIQSRYYETDDSSGSGSTHTALWLVDFSVAMNNPFLGIGHQNFQDVSVDYRSVAAGTGAESAIGTYDPHNDFLNVWLSWGFLALVAYVFFFLGMLRNFARAAQCADPFIRAFAVGCAGGVVAYAAGAAFHNYMDSSMLLWIFAGLSVAMARVAARQPTTNPIRLLRNERRARQAARVR